MNTAQLKYLIVDKIYDIDDIDKLMQIRKYIEEISDSEKVEIKDEYQKN